MITMSARWPLIIDPQLQGIKWLRSRFENMEGTQLVVLQTTQNSWTTRLEDAIQNGDVVVMENMGVDIDAVMDPLLMRSFYRKGRSMFLKFGDNEVAYDENFKLFLQTKLSNPSYKPEIFASCSVINFIVTEAGLEEQLLAKVVGKEKPELEQQAAELLVSFNRYKIQLLQLEDELLDRLANAPEDILSDVELIESLEATKQTSAEVNEAVEQGKQTQEILLKARDKFRPVSKEASMLYFLIIQLCNVEHMYQYSLDGFMVFFFKSIRIAEKADTDEERVLALRESLRKTIFKWVSRGLFQRHILIFLTQLVLNLLKREVVGLDVGFTPSYMKFLLRGSGGAVAEKSPVEWLTSGAWAAVDALSEVEDFENFASDVEENAPRFKEWYNHTSECLRDLSFLVSGEERSDGRARLLLSSSPGLRCDAMRRDAMRSALPWDAL